MIDVETLIHKTMELETRYYELQDKYHTLIHEYETLKDKYEQEKLSKPTYGGTNSTRHTGAEEDLP